MINYLCLAYYYIYNKLDLSKINKKYVKLLNGNTLVWKKQDFELILLLMQTIDNGFFK